VWAADGSPRSLRQAHDAAVVAIRFAETGLQAYTVGADQRVHTWDLGQLVVDPSTSQASGALTNNRVCVGTTVVVAVVPFPPAGSVWAPASACP
jgi:hypothetical protein